MTDTMIVEAAFTVDRSLRNAEEASTGSATAAADLLLTLLKQHAVMGAPDTVGLSAIRHASRAASLSVEAREEQIRAHGALNIDLKKLGLDELFSKGSSPPAMPTITRAGGAIVETQLQPSS